MPGQASVPAMAQIVVGVGAIAVRDGRLLLVRRGKPPAQGLWAPPGGRVEFGETLPEAVLRELREETGLSGRTLGPCGLAERIGHGYHRIIHDLWVELDPGEPVAGDDADAVTFASRSDLNTLPLVPHLMAFLADHDVLDRLVG